MLRFLPVATTLLAGTAGALLFYYLGAPAAFLTGSAVAVTLCVALRLRTDLPRNLREPFLAVLGVMMGSGVKPDTLSALAELPVAIVGLVVAVSGATAASYLVLRRVGGWDPLTALCGSIPGALQVTLATAVELGARVDRVVMSQALRLFILVAIIPLVFGRSEGGSTMDAFAAPDATTLDVALSFLLAFVCLLVSRSFTFPSGPVVLPLCISAILSGAGILTISIPPVVAAATFIVLGASVAQRFDSTKGRDIWTTVWLSLAAFAAAFSVCISVAAVFSTMMGEPLGAVFLAYAPGGVDAMIALSFLLGFDVAFVAVLHILRLILLSIAGPVIAIQMKRRSEAALLRRSGTAD
ncbi:AbrB family transcriptional regulator [Acuticoccus sp. MNP-M23]|uniref:AbrB family transcriptional regulator n=1 Tax=Acuticoccus sp. MNP-M23 TaxID=3072793 RepID=UPI0028156408|nr:AbrB family transcriptional regulator [Acuticoccus sp. MNP-M23]WMS41447.1 AbrB family transcriptional regulator [Acuticoccus sp. MNP-M23]